MHGFFAGLDPEDQPPSYCLPMGNASVDINDHITLSSSGMWSEKVSKLVPYMGVCSHRYYRVEVELSTFF